MGLEGIIKHFPDVIEPKPSRGLRAAIFDVDGVLVASPHERAWREALQELMCHEWKDIAALTGYAPDHFTNQLYQELIAGKPRLDGARAALEYFRVPDIGRRVQEYADQKQRRLVDLIDAGEFVGFEDAIRFVSALGARGWLLAVASSSKNATALLRHIYPESDSLSHTSPGTQRTLCDLFGVDVSGRDLPRGKPDPAIFLLAATELDVPPSACLVVEDAPAGIRAAKAGGMMALGVARSNDQALLVDAGADCVVHTLDEIDVEALTVGRLTIISTPGGSPEQYSH